MSRLLEAPKREISDVKEKAFQRAIFYSNLTTLPRIKGKRRQAKVKWYALESPIDKNREINGKGRGEHNVDLIGKDNISNRFIICEVKYSCNKKDNPEDAAKEAFNYYKIIIGDAIELDNIATHHRGEEVFKWQDIKPEESEIWIVANSAYWVYWLGCKNQYIPKVYNNKQVRCFSIDIPENYFAQQKGHNKLYKPVFIESPTWTELF